MKTKTLLALGVTLLGVNLAGAQSTGFTYQGRLMDNGAPATGNYDLRFYLRDAPSLGIPVGPTNTFNGVTPVVASNGLFTVVLDFGAGIFTGPARWLEMGVRTNGSVDPYATLAPRQQLTPTPYAIYAAGAATATSANSAASATTATSATSFTGSLAGNVTGTQSATVVATVGGQTAANVASGAIAVNAATSVNTPNTIVKRDASGNFSAGTIAGNLAGNATTATSATSFTGSLAGNVTGTQGATVVATVGGQTAANVASGAIAANAATSANTPNTIIKRDASGSFAAGVVTATNFFGNGVGLTGLNAANLVGNLPNGFGAAGNFNVGAALTVDNWGNNNGAVSPALTFGYASGEGIGSKRTAGGNQYGLDFYASNLPRISIANGGAVGIGTTTPEDALLDVEGDTHINDHDIFMRAGSDRAHGIGYRSTIAGSGIDGPFVYGWNGGALGVSGPDLVALSWDWHGNVWAAQHLATTTFSTSGNADLNGVTRTLGGLVIENRTSDPPSPATGQIWLRTDL